MKKTFLTMLFMVVAMGAFAQMQVWSNGTIIFSHNTNDVDSISFAGGVNASYVAQSGNTSLSVVGLTFVNYNQSGGNNYIYNTITFLNATEGFLAEQHSNYYDDNPSYFTYTINGNVLNITFTNGRRSGGNAVGVIGQSALWLETEGTGYPFLIWK